MPHRWMTPALLLLALACDRDGPEAQVRKAFHRCVQAVERGDAAGATEPLADRFLGPEGLDRAGARLYLMGLLRGQKVGITVLSEDVSVDGSTAQQQVELLLTAKGGGLLPEKGSRRAFLLTWEKNGGTWRLRTLREG